MKSRQATLCERLEQSISSCVRLLYVPRIARNVVFGLLFIQTGLLAYSAYVHSPTLNEPAHLVAGLSHWKFGRFELYRVNPPLVRMVAALPVMTADYEQDWSGFHDGPGARPVFAMGEDFIAANGERSFFLFMIARWACIPFSWIGGIVCYLWARDLYGRPAGVLACALWCFSPNILAHASLITADAHATALGLAACYTFWRWLRQPTWTQAALTGCVLGLAELAKTTLILFYPLWPVMWILYRWPDRKRMLPRRWLNEAGMLLLRMVIGIYILNLGYGFEDSFKPLGEFHFVSQLFTATENAKQQQASSNRFANSWLGALPVPCPKSYLLGIDIQQRDFERYGRPSYLRGEWRDQGWWYYYLYAAAIKVPLGYWLLAIFALLGQPVTETGSHRPHKLRDSMFLLAPPLVIFTVVSMKTGFNEHFRYVLPCFPFIFIWISRIAVCRLTTALASLKFRAKGALSSAAILGALTWSVTSSLWIYPHSLSYFNETIGGPLHGPEHLLGSNVDWGQDLRYLKWHMTDHAQSPGQSIHLAYFGYFDPANAGFESALPCCASLLNANRPLESNSWSNMHVSVNFLYGSVWPPRDGENDRCPVDVDALRSLKSATPTSYTGFSIRGYKPPKQQP